MFSRLLLDFFDRKAERRWKCLFADWYRCDGLSHSMSDWARAERLIPIGISRSADRASDG